MHKIATVSAAALLLSGPSAHAAGDGARNKFAFAMANVSLAQKICGYTSNDSLMAGLMRDAGVTNKDEFMTLTFDSFTMQVTQAALAEIAADKVKWCSGVWDAFGDDGLIQKGAVSDPDHKRVMPAPAVFGTGKIKACWVLADWAKPNTLHFARGLILRDLGQTPMEDDGGVAQLNITVVLDGEATLRKTDECVTIPARLIDNPEKPREGDAHPIGPVLHSLTPQQKRVLTPDGLMTETQGGFTLADQPPEFRQLPVEVTVVSAFGSKPEHAVKGAGK